MYALVNVNALVNVTCDKEDFTYKIALICHFVLGFLLKPYFIIFFKETVGGILLLCAASHPHSNYRSNIWPLKRVC